MAKKKVMALGFFDGIHIGHAALMNMIIKRAREYDAEPAVLTFDVHPDSLVFKKNVPLINSADDRERILSRCFGIDDVVVVHFSQSVMHMDWKVFIDELIDDMELCHIVVGHDFKFGYKGLGTAEKLKEYCAQRGVGCDIIPPVCKDGVIVSSTLIRGLIESGEIEKANEYLGRPHTLTDVVRSGYHLGTQMGTPTINMRFPDGVIIPRHGVYAAKVYLEGGESYVAVTNVGIRPTVGNGNSVTVESHLLDYSGNLYGRQARVEFYKFLRPEKKFSGFEELSTQIRRDTESAKEYFESRDKK